MDIIREDKALHKGPELIVKATEQYYPGRQTTKHFNSAKGIYNLIKAKIWIRLPRPDRTNS